MVLNQSVNLEHNHFCACYTWHVYQDRKIEYWEEDYVYIHIKVAHLLLMNYVFLNCRKQAQVGFRVEVAPDLVGVYPTISTSSVSMDPFLCYDWRWFSCLCDFLDRLLGVFPALSSPLHAQKNPKRAFSHLGHWHEGSVLACGLPVLPCTNSLLWLFWPYSRRGACRTVVAVPHLLAL